MTAMRRRDKSREKSRERKIWRTSGQKSGRTSGRTSGRASASRDDSRLYGLHAVAAALENPRRHCRRLLLSREGCGRERLLRLAAQRSPSCPVEISDAKRLAALLPAAATHQGAALEAAPLAERSLEEAAASAWRLALLDRVTDPRNVGAVLRSAAAFRVDGVVLERRWAPPLSGALAKAASGALERIAIIRVASIKAALRWLKGEGWLCIGLAAEAERSLEALTTDRRLALALGGEGAGLRQSSREHCDMLLSIRQERGGGQPSLNIASAAAIAFHACYRRPAGRGDGDQRGRRENERRDEPPP